jgi:hypothetical protein
VARREEVPRDPRDARTLRRTYDRSTDEVESRADALERYRELGVGASAEAAYYAATDTLE